MTRKPQPAHLRLVVNNEPRRYAQSTSDLSDSHLTAPPERFSMRMARDSAASRQPYAMFRRCPTVVSQSSANDSRSAGVSDFQKVLKSTPNYHHAVIENATPNGEFTDWCSSADNEDMENSMAGIRRANLARLIERDFAGNLSAIARIHDPQNPKPQYFSDILRPSSGKSFGEKAARKIEQAVGLVLGQLDIRNSPLLIDHTRKDVVKDTLLSTIDDLDRDEQREALAAIRKIQARRGTRRKVAV